MSAEFTNLIMGIINGTEWIAIIVVIAIVIFGAKKVPELARSFGKATSEYEKAKIEAKNELRRMRNLPGGGAQDNREKLEAVADTLGIDYSDKNNSQLRAAIQAEMDKERKTI
jgi:sec-independent protein translocase protein TatA